MTIKYVKLHEVKAGVTYKFIDSETGEYRYITAVSTPSKQKAEFHGFHCATTPSASRSLYEGQPKNINSCGYLCSEYYFNNLGVNKIGDLPKTVYSPEELEEGVVYRIINPIGANYIKPTSSGTLLYNPLLGWFFSSLTPVPYLVHHLCGEQAILEVADEYPSILGEL